MKPLQILPRQLFISHIYIPHGSDETTSADFALAHLIRFISHMVQMKQKAMIKQKQKHHNLYPTWFR
ncbi:hypothetical protein THER_1271 [Thermodesulfovibrio sp. N1]|nr:hypothetical protein THER_1271 [Thermodesulfovibrio sp. N1]